MYEEGLLESKMDTEWVEVLVFVLLLRDDKEEEKNRGDYC